MREKRLNIRRKQMGDGGSGVEHLFFGPGSQVEVTGDDIGFKDSWYVATIIQTLTPSSSSNKKKRKIETTYLVEYATLVQDEQDFPLREYVDVSLIRPLPPPTEATYAYEVGDVVDAFRRDGWWTGVVVGVVNGGSKLLVFFEIPPEEKIEFARADLRVHHDWVDFKWVRAEKKTPRLRPAKSSAKSIKNKKQQVIDPQKLNFKEIIEPKSEVKLEIGGESAIASCGKNVSEKDTNSVFEKRSPIWGMLEHVEIFQKMPQQPHFSPLVSAKEDSREGLAIGKMVIFSGVVEKISKLQVSDPRNVIDSSLETLSELETHGFDVRPIRQRLNELLSKKENQGQLLEKSKEVEMRIAEKCLEKRKLGDEIREINKKMEELQEREKMTDREIDALKSEMDVIDQVLQNTQHNFEKLAAAPW